MLIVPLLLSSAGLSWHCHTARGLRHRRCALMPTTAVTCARDGQQLSCRTSGGAFADASQNTALGT